MHLQLAYVVGRETGCNFRMASRLQTKGDGHICLKNQSSLVALQQVRELASHLRVNSSSRVSPCS